MLAILKFLHDTCALMILCSLTSNYTSHKKFSEGKQVHVGMETSKTNQTRWE